MTAAAHSAGECWTQMSRDVEGEIAAERILDSSITPSSRSFSWEQSVLVVAFHDFIFFYCYRRRSRQSMRLPYKRKKKIERSSVAQWEVIRFKSSSTVTASLSTSRERATDDNEVEWCHTQNFFVFKTRWISINITNWMIDDALSLTIISIFLSLFSPATHASR